MRGLLSAGCAIVLLASGPVAHAEGVATSASASTPPASSTPAPAATPAAQPPPPPGSCVDEDLKGDLVGGRHYRGVQPRLFTKAFRHELTGFGGWLAGDANDGAPYYGGAYTFHFSEDLGLELSVGFSRARARLADTIANRYPQPIEVYRNNRRVRQYLGQLYWSLAYGKMRWMGGAISRFDFHLAFGGGVADDEVSRGLMGTAGLGGKIYLTSWLALRLELRDQLSSQKILDETRIVNDLLFYGGLSVFFPFKG